MQSTQDQIPTHRLTGEMALDTQGRVLRRPHFLTKREHDQMLNVTANAWAEELLRAERAEKKARVIISEMQINGVVILRPHIFYRSRLRWLIRWLIKVK